MVMTTNQQIRTYGQYFARQVLIRFSIDPTEKVEPIIANMSMQYFPGIIFIEEKHRVIEEVKKDWADLTLWCNGSKLNQERVGAIVVSKLENSWLMQKITLGKYKEIFDAEMYGVSEAVKDAEQNCLRSLHLFVISKFCDS